MINDWDIKSFCIYKVLNTVIITQVYKDEYQKETFYSLTLYVKVFIFLLYRYMKVLCFYLTNYLYAKIATLTLQYLHCKKNEKIKKNPDLKKSKIIQGQMSFV